MKRVAKLFLALAVVASPMLFTSCDDYDDNDDFEEYNFDEDDES